MEDHLGSKKSQISAEMGPGDLKEILDRIEEYSSFWQVLNNDQVLLQDEDLEIPDLHPLDQITAISDGLKLSSAPLYSSMEVVGARRIILRSLNLISRILGSEQIRFNHNMRELLGELMLTLQASQRREAAVKSILLEMNAKVEALEEENASQNKEIDLLNEQIFALRADLYQKINNDPKNQA